MPVVPDWFIKGLVVYNTVYGLHEPKRRVGVFQKLSTGSGFPFVSYMSITVTQGDVKLPTKQQPMPSKTLPGGPVLYLRNTFWSDTGDIGMLRPTSHYLNTVVVLVRQYLSMPQCDVTDSIRTHTGK